MFDGLKDFGGGWPSSSSSDDDGKHPTTTSNNHHPDSQRHTSDNEDEDMLGLDVWPGALALCNYISKTPQIVYNKTTLELGAGIALPAFLAAKLHATPPVICSDYQQAVVDFYPSNAALNDLENHIQGQRIDWVDISNSKTNKNNINNSLLQQQYQVLLAADVMYEEKFALPLLDTIETLLHPTQGILLLSHQSRRAIVMDPELGIPRIDDQDRPFMAFVRLMEERGMVVRVLGESPAPPGFPGPMRVMGIGMSGGGEVIEKLPAWDSVDWEGFVTGVI